MFIGLILPVIAGYELIVLLFARYPLPFFVSLALAYGLGMGLLTQWMFLLGVLGIPYTLGSLPGGVILFIVILIYPVSKVYKRQRQQTTPANHQGQNKLDFISKCCLVYVCWAVYWIFWRALNIPVSSWDAISTIAFKAKIIFYDQSLINIGNSPHAAYPLHVSFLQAWMAFNMHGWHEQWVNLIFPCAFVSYLIMQFHFLRTLTNERWALLGLVLLISSNLLTFHASIGYRDFFLLYYNCTTIILILLFRILPHTNALLLLAGLFGGFTSFVKVEGTFYLLIHTIVLLVVLFTQNAFSFKEKLKKVIFFIIPSYSICGFYHLFRILSGISIEEKGQFLWPQEIFSKVLIFFTTVIQNLFLTGNWNLLWVLFFLSLLKRDRIKRLVEVRLLLLALLLSFGFLSFLALFTASFIWIAGSQAATTLPRMTLHFLPLVIMVIVLLNCPLLKEK